MSTRRKLTSFILVLVMVMSVIPTVTLAGSSSNDVYAATLKDYVTASTDTSEDVTRIGQGGTGATGNQKIYFFHGAANELLNGGVYSSPDAFNANKYGYKYTVSTDTDISDSWVNYITDQLDSTKDIKFGITFSGSHTNNTTNINNIPTLFLPEVNIFDAKDASNKPVLTGGAIFDGATSISAFSLTSGGSARGYDIFFKIPANSLSMDKTYMLVFNKGIKVNDKGNNKYSIDKKISFSFTTKAPEVDKPTATAKSNSYNSIKLSWDKVANVDGYAIYKYDAKSKKYVEKATTENTTYIDQKLKTGTNETYNVKAYKAYQGTKYYSEASKDVKAKPILSVPTKVKAKSKKSKAIISWKKVTGSNGYVVYRATKKNGKYKKVATLKGNKKVKYTSKKLKAGKKYYFKVKAYRTVSGKKVMSKYTAAKRVKIKK